MSLLRIPTLGRLPRLGAVGGGGAAPIPWYLAGGVMPTAVYDAKAAASIAASRVNLANPGTLDMTQAGNPTWSAANGWGGFSSADYFNTGITPGTDVWSVLCVTRVVTAFGWLFGAGQTTPSRGINCSALDSATQAYMRYGSAGNYATMASSVWNTPTVVLLANNRAYVNGNQVLALTYGTPDISIPLFLGTENNAGTPHGNKCVGYIYAFWAYKGTLDAAQCTALMTAAMSNFQ